MTRPRFVAAVCATAILLSAASLQAQAPGGSPTPTPFVKQFYDIAVHGLWVDAATCQLWVRYTNLGNRTITQTLGYSIKVEGVEVDKGLMGFNLAPGGFFACGVGSDQHPVRVLGRKAVEARIDTGNVLPELVSKRANNLLSTHVEGCRMARPPLGAHP